MKQYFFLLGILLSATAISQAQVNDTPQNGPNYVVNVLSDTNDGICGTSNCTLREAINAANNDEAHSAITFDATVFAPPRKTITLGGTQLLIKEGVPSFNNSLNIVAPAAGVVLDGNGQSRIFEITGDDSVQMVGLTLTGGQADLGGALYISANARQRLYNCTLSGNSASNAGGAIYKVGSQYLFLESCTLSGNTAVSGGGISNSISSGIYISNCTLSGNRATSSGGAILNNDQAYIVLFNSTISSNSAPDGGIVNFGSMQISHAILNAGAQGVNFMNSGSGTLSPQGHNISSDGTGPNGTTDKINTDPLLGPLADNGGPTQTHALRNGSPAIDAGSTGGPDQRGRLRPYDVATIPNGSGPYDNGSDIGAFEFGATDTLQNGPNYVVNSKDGSNDGACSVAQCSLLDAVRAANQDGVDGIITFDDGLDSTITFDETVFGKQRQTIELYGQPADIGNGGSLVIIGPAVGVEIRSITSNRTFSVDYNTTATLIGLTISGGEPGAPGGHSGTIGGISNRGRLTLEACTLTSNTSFAGSAIYSHSTMGGVTLIVRNCTLSGNTATHRGGAIYNDHGLAFIENSTITANTAPAGSGGGIAFGGEYGSVTKVINSIIAGNIGTDVDLTSDTGMNTIQSHGYNLIGDGNATGEFVESGDQVIGNNDPLLGPLADNGGPTQTHALLQGSPAINRIYNYSGTDQRGVTRAQGVMGDIGAYEAIFLSIGDVTIVEGDSGTKNAVFPVTLGAAVNAPVSVNYATVNSSAQSSSDFSLNLSDSDGGTPGVLTIAANQTTGSITVPIVGDILDEVSEVFYVLLSSPVNAVFRKARATGFINDNDAPPSFSINNVIITEGNTGTRNANFLLRLNRPSGQVVSVDVGSAISGGSASAGVDYQFMPRTTISFAPGQTQRIISIAVLGDTLDENNESFFVNLSNVRDATVSDNQGVGLITDDDQPPALSIGDASIVEGHSGTKILTFTVSLLSASGKNASVQFATADGIARASSDYRVRSGSLNFAPGQTSKIISIIVNGDTQVEGDETVYVLLSNPINAVIARGRAQGTILNDDASG